MIIMGIVWSPNRLLHIFLCILRGTFLGIMAIRMMKRWMRISQSRHAKRGSSLVNVRSVILIIDTASHISIISMYDERTQL